MASKIKDLYSPFNNPAGGILSGIKPLSISDFFNNKQQSAPQMSVATPAQLATPLRSPMNTPIGATGSNLGTTGSSGPIFNGPTGSSGPTGATGVTAPSQWIKPDGTFYTPDEIAGNIGNTLQKAHGAGDISKLSGDQFGGDTKTADQLAADARGINNARNDIAVGENDPYKVASASGIAYTPQELAAIEKAYSGVYDPAINSAMAKVDAKQKADALANTPFTLGKDDVRYDGKGNPIAVGIPSTPIVGSYIAGSNPTVDAYVEGIKNGVYKTSDVPDQYKNLVAQGISESTKSGQLSKTSIDALGIINQLQGDPAIDRLSGTGAIGALEHPSSLFPGTEVQNTQNLAKQLQATISLANRQQLKGQGAISDFEFKVLGDAATALGLNGDGRTNLSPEKFKDQLGKLKTKLSVGPLKTLTDDEVQYLTSQGHTPDEIRALDSSQSFNSVGNTKASTNSSGQNIPQRNNNPGNVKSGGLADSLATGTDQYGHLVFKNPIDGFKALQLDLTAKINGQSKYLPDNPTVAQLGKVYAEDPAWGDGVAKILGISPSTPTKNIPITQLAQAIAKQEGFFAS